MAEGPTHTVPLWADDGNAVGPTASTRSSLQEADDAVGRQN